MSKFAVVGAGSSIGSKLCSMLADLNPLYRIHPVTHCDEKLVSLVSSFEHHKHLVHWENPAALANALEQCNILVLLKPSVLTSDTINLTRAYVETAKRANGRITHIILVSGTGATISSTNLSKLRLTCEQLVEESNIPYTIVRPSFLHEDFMDTHANSIRKTHTVYNPFHSAPFPSHSEEDLALFVSRVCAEPRAFSGQKYTLCQFMRESSTIPKHIKTLSSLLGRPINNVPISDEEWKERLKLEGKPEFHILHMSEVAMIVRCMHPGLILTSDDFFRVMGREVTSFDDWARHHLDAFK